MKASAMWFAWAMVKLKLGKKVSSHSTAEQRSRAKTERTEVEIVFLKNFSILNLILEMLLNDSVKSTMKVASRNAQE